MIVTQVMGDKALINMDGMGHRQLRDKLLELLSASHLDTTLAALEVPISSLKIDLEAGRTVDLVPFVHLLTGKGMCHLLGLEPAKGHEDDSYAEIYDLGNRLSSFIRLRPGGLSRNELQQAHLEYDRLVQYVRECNLASGSIVEGMRELGLSSEEATAVIAVLMIAGTATVSTAVPRIFAILADTGQLTHLRHRPELLSSAVDEGLRCVVPSPMMVRGVAQETVISGHRFREGTRVLIFTYNLLKHPRYFPKPRRFDISRVHSAEIKHLWFGGGPHFCLGFGLANREIRAVLQVLLDLPGEIRVVSRKYARKAAIPAYSKLEVKLA